MNVLIIGLGYSGTRFLRAFNYLSSKDKSEIRSINLAYVGKHKKKCDLTYFSDINVAITQFKPQIVVVAVNDEFHAEVLNKLHGFTGFVICEKPFVTHNDDLNILRKNLNSISGFCLDLIERYSEASITLKKYIHTHQLKLIRANFHWGKDRINDRRPTCGVTSEVIHALDLIQHMYGESERIELHGVIGNRSDFSISGPEVLDSVALTAKLGHAVITGYSSFVNIVRKREIDLTFVSPQQKLIYANMIFDTPAWDMDCLRIWEKTSVGEQTLLDLHTQFDKSNFNLATIQKLVCLVNDVVGYVANGTLPCQPFPGIHTALSLQEVLNAIEHKAVTVGPVQYIIGQNREFLNDENDLERLG